MPSCGHPVYQALFRLFPEVLAASVCQRVPILRIRKQGLSYEFCTRLKELYCTAGRQNASVLFLPGVQTYSQPETEIAARPRGLPMHLLFQLASCSSFRPLRLHSRYSR